jgi:hypothetical protein
MSPITRRRRRFPVEIEQQIRSLYLEGSSAADISAALEGEADAPSEKTIKRRLRELAAAEGSEMWSVRNAKPEDLPLVFPVLAELISQTNGRVRSLTKARAEWIARIRRSAPDIPAWQALQLSSTYLSAYAPGGREDDAHSADIFLAYAPWKDDEAFDAYARLFDDRGLRGLTRFSAVTDEDSSRFWLGEGSSPKARRRRPDDPRDLDDDEQEQFEDYVKRATALAAQTRARVRAKQPRPGVRQRKG